LGVIVGERMGGMNLLLFSPLSIFIGRPRIIA
jgi:hypothetical protein